MLIINVPMDDNMDAAQKTLGRPVDTVDKALNNRKHCINCVARQHGGYISYKFDAIIQHLRFDKRRCYDRY